jgi:hypothetical protein
MLNLYVVRQVLERRGLSDRFDAKKVLLKIGGKRPGKRCKKGWIAADKQCSDHKTADGKLTAAGKASARELADKVRLRKGLGSRQQVAKPKAEKARNLANKEYFTFANSTSQKGSVAGLTAANAKAARLERESGRAQIWNKPFSEKSMKVFGYGSQAVHRKQVEKAIRRGDPVPKDVLDQYPEFQGLTRDRTQRPSAKTSMRDIVREMNRESVPSVNQIAPSDLKIGDRKQAVTYNEQGAARAKSEGRSADASAWNREASKSRIADIKSRQRLVNTSQGELFGIEETTDLPLFRQRKDGFRRRFDRAIDGGKKRSTKKKAKCSPKSQQCGAICIPITKECRDGAVGSAQERLKKLKQTGADDLQVQRAKESIKSRTIGKRAELTDRRIKRLRDRVKNAAIGGAVTPGGLAELDPNSIAVDPKRFQYKIIGEHTASGSVGSLSGVRKYDPNLAGILQVWQDPADGKTYVVNGHNRLDLAKKLGANSVAVRYLKSPDAKSARAIGALTNIAEGRGDALDAAKFFRDTGISKEDLTAKGIPMREKIATDGLALSKLDDSLFRRTIDGEIPLARAAIVGGSGLDAASQRDLMKLVDKEGKRKNLTDGAIAEMVDIAKSAQTSQETTLSLFGEETVTKSNMVEKAKLQASIKQRLSREKNLFGTVSRGRAAQELSRGGNTIDAEKSGEISANADRALKQFDQMKNLSGPVSDAINRAATRMSNGESQKAVEKDLYAEISSIDIFGSRQRRAA